MLGSLVALPLRAVARSLTVPYRATRGAVEVAEGVVGLVLVRLRRDDDHDESPPRRPSSERRAAEPAAWRPPTANAPAPPASTTASVPAPAHVSEEPELVEEVSEPGAQDGAGAQIRIGEPWEGYRSMKAADIVDRLASASREELATVELFEAVNRNRKTVIAAAQRALEQASPPR